MVKNQLTRPERAMAGLAACLEYNYHGGDADDADTNHNSKHVNSDTHANINADDANACL